jgi:hypothetical protein
MLRNASACSDQVDLFRERFGESVDVTEATCLAVADLFDWYWAAAHLLPAPALAEFDRATATAHAEYLRATATDWAEYYRATATTHAEYQRAVAPARAEYARAQALSFARAADEGGGQ